MRRTAAHMPDHWLFLPIKTGNVRLASFFGLMDSTSAAAPLSAPMTVDSWLSAAHGRRERVLAPVADGRLRLPEGAGLGRRRGRLAGRRRRRRPRTSRRMAGAGSILGNPGTEFIWAGGRLVDAWPANPSDNAYRRVQTSKVRTLLIGGNARLRDAGPERDQGAPAAPAERPPGRAGRARPHDRLLELPAGGEHAADQHLPRHREGRRLALHPPHDRLQPGRDADGARQGHPRRDGRPRRSSPSLSLLWCRAACAGAAASAARRARRSGRCTRSSSASAAGSSAR